MLIVNGTQNHELKIIIKIEIITILLNFALKILKLFCINPMAKHGRWQTIKRLLTGRVGLYPKAVAKVICEHAAPDQGIDPGTHQTFAAGGDVQ